jgi:hypothetical protein
MKKAKGLRKAKQRTDWDAWLEELQKVEDDRAVAILGAAFLDAWLEESLRSFFVDDEEEVNALLDRALGNFGARIGASFSLGLVSPADLADLRIIQGIRNDFAHMMQGLSFEDPDVKPGCLRLKSAAGVFGGRLARNPRQVFIVSVVQLAHRIALSAEAAKLQRRQVGPPYKPVKVILDPRHAGGAQAGA